MTKWLLRAALAAVVLFALAISVGIWQGSTAILRPPWYAHRAPEEGLAPFENNRSVEYALGRTKDPLRDYGFAFEDVEIPAIDGSVLRGWYVPPAYEAPGQKAGVITVHGAGGDRRDFLRQLPLLHEAGYPVLMFDCREHGISDGARRGVAFGVREHEDVAAAVDWVASELDWERIGVLGGSQGGASVILAAATDPDIDAVVAENPFTDIYSLVRFATANGSDGPPPADWLVDLATSLALLRAGGLSSPAPIDVVEQISPRPLFLIHGTADQVIPHDHSERIHARSGEPVELWIAPDAGHGTIYNLYPEEYRDRVIGFFDRALRNDS